MEVWKSLKVKYHAVKNLLKVKYFWYFLDTKK